MKSLFSPVFSRFVATTAACALLGITAFAQAPGATPAEKPKPLSSGDSLYVRNTLKSLNYQIQLGKVGSGITDDYIKRIVGNVTDLSKPFDALSKIATEHGEKIPTEITGIDKVDLDRVTKSKPDKLTKEWLDAVAKEAKHLDHETEMAGKTAQDVDLKTYIINYGPTFRNLFTTSDEADKAQKKTH